MLHLRATSGKLFFAVDLDETVFVTVPRLDSVHPDHILSKPSCHPVLTDFEQQVFDIIPALLINRLDLSRVFETACQLGYELVILTSGTYEKQSILNLLQNNLMVSQETREKIGLAHYHSSLTDSPEKTLEALKQTTQMKKGQRIVALRRQFPNLRGTWVLFDDNPMHIHSCQGIEGVHGILATTDEPNKDCYEKVLFALKKIHQQKAETSAVEALLLLRNRRSRAVDHETEKPEKRSKLY